MKNAQQDKAARVLSYAPFLGSDAGRFNRLQLVFTRAFELGYATEGGF